jgi:serine-type D-Ala-D-Ala carboxypeptidase (penicillin-binding protein 5/6)
VKPRLVVTTTGLLASAALAVASPTAAVPTQAPAAATGATAATPVVTHRTTYRPTGDVTAPPRIRARAWVVVDMATGAILGRHKARAGLPQASTMKLLTALTATHRISASRPLRATRLAAGTICSCAGVIAGKHYTRNMLFGGMLVKSGNDAAEAVAGADPKSRARFIAGMNNTAARLGASDTVAKNPSGLDAAGAHSSARDLVLLLRAASRRPAIAGWLDTPRVRFGAIGGRKHLLTSSTDYLRRFPDSYAAKNGFTTRARNTLVAASRIGTSDLGAALLGAPEGFTTSGVRSLIVWAQHNAGFLAPVGRLPGS